jgi:hypothetical protein
MHPVGIFPVVEDLNPKVVVNSVATEPPPPPLQLYPGYYGHTQVDLSEVTDIYSLETLDELRTRNVSQSLPYYFIGTKDTEGTVHFYDAYSLLIDKHKYKHIHSAMTRRLYEGTVYKVESQADLAEKFCSFADVLGQHEHFAKCILATGPENLDKRIRGEARHYIGGLYEYSPKTDLMEADFWYNKAAEDGSYAAHVALAGWYQEGYHYAKSLTRAIEHLQKAIELIPPELQEEKELLLMQREELSTLLFGSLHIENPSPSLR